MRPIVLLAAALLLAGCGGSGPEIAGPADQVFASGGLEQQFRIAQPWPDSDPAWFHLTSRLVNRGDAPVTVRVATCWLDPEVNLRTDAPYADYAIPSCPHTPDVVTLEPGESSGTVWFSARIRRAGRYRMLVRHALDPELWGEIELTAR